MSAQLSLLLGGGDVAPSTPVCVRTVEPVTGEMSYRRLPLLRSVPLSRSVLVDGRLRSYVTLPGYRTGQKPGNAGRTWPVEILTHAEMLRLLDACGGGLTGARNRALYVMMWRTGLRIAEVLALVPRDVDLEARTVLVRHGKGDRRRVVGFDERTAEIVTHWLALRSELCVGRDKPIFCVVQQPTTGGPLWQSCCREALAHTALLAGIEKRVTPHSCRHLFACDLAAEGVPLNIISKLLGHSNSATTSRYLDHVWPADAILVACSRSWADLSLVAA